MSGLHHFTRLDYQGGPKAQRDGFTPFCSRTNGLPLRTMTSYSPKEPALWCRRCRSTMEVVLKSGQTSERRGRYYVCPRRCGLGRSWKSEIPDCPFCYEPMTFHIGRKTKWKGVAVWWCEEHRFFRVPPPKPQPKTQKKPQARNKPTAPKKPSRRVIYVSDRDIPLGNRSVSPGSMYKSRDGW